MSSSRNSNEASNITSVALELFKARCSQTGISAQQMAIECFRQAKAFHAVTELVLSGAINSSEDDLNPLDAAFAPNLKRTHPVNLMSTTWGDRTKVETVLAELEANPAAEVYEPYEWGKPEVSQARALFPSVVNRIKQLSSTK